jgi:catabolite regulation protein CreA
VVEVFDDPLVQGVSCYVSRAKTGGIKGAFGLAEDPSNFSVNCQQTGAITFTGPLPRKTIGIQGRCIVDFQTRAGCEAGGCET